MTWHAVSVVCTTDYDTTTPPEIILWSGWPEGHGATDIASSRTFMKAERSKFQSFQFCANGSNSWLKLIGWSWSWSCCLSENFTGSSLGKSQGANYSLWIRKTSWSTVPLSKAPWLAQKMVDDPLSKCSCKGSILVLDADQDIGFFPQLI